ncbi:MAG: iron chelate uptake ABC transporter family permease subunit [Rhizobiales bacterium]|nr:iron chelate uptake ABC transporter family permease subunit [Hyphomicrobiales bacterium]
MRAAVLTRPASDLWRRPETLLVMLGLLLVASFVMSLSIGAMAIGPVDILLSLFGLTSDHTVASVVMELRLPRALMAVVTGAALGVSGAALQGLFRNPLADPGLIGVSSGAALGAVCAIVLGATLTLWLPLFGSRFLVPVFAFAGALAACLATQMLARRHGSTALLLLGGIAINALAGAMTGFFVYASNDNQLRDFTFWSMGSLAAAGWQGLYIAVPMTLPALYLIWTSARSLDAMLLGEREARHLGVDVVWLKRRIFICSALAVGISVALCGVIAFVGVVVPHLVRLVAGPAHRLVLPGSAMLGGALLLLADSLARVSVAPAELPVGLVTAALGSPFFIWLLMRQRSFS